MTSPHLLTDNGAIHQETLELFGEIFAVSFRVPIRQSKSYMGQMNADNFLLVVTVFIWFICGH